MSLTWLVIRCWPIMLSQVRSFSWVCSFRVKYGLSISRTLIKTGFITTRAAWNTISITTATSFLDSVPHYRSTQPRFLCWLMVWLCVSNLTSHKSPQSCDRDHFIQTTWILHDVCLNANRRTTLTAFQVASSCLLTITAINKESDISLIIHFEPLIPVSYHQITIRQKVGAFTSAKPCVRQQSNSIVACDLSTT